VQRALHGEGLGLHFTLDLAHSLLAYAQLSPFVFCFYFLTDATAASKATAATQDRCVLIDATEACG